MIKIYNFILLYINIKLSYFYFTGTLLNRVIKFLYLITDLSRYCSENTRIIKNTKKITKILSEINKTYAFCSQVGSIRWLLNKIVLARTGYKGRTVKYTYKDANYFSKIKYLLKDQNSFNQMFTF